MIVGVLLRSLLFYIVFWRLLWLLEDRLGLFSYVLDLIYISNPLNCIDNGNMSVNNFLLGEA